MPYNDTSNLSTYFYARCLEIPSDITTLEVDDILNILYPEVLPDEDVDIEDEDDEDEPNLPAPSFDTATSCLDTVMKFLRTLPCSEKQSQFVRELQDFLADLQLNRLQQSSITSFFQSDDKH